MKKRLISCALVVIMIFTMLSVNKSVFGAEKMIYDVSILKSGGHFLLDVYTSDQACMLNISTSGGFQTAVSNRSSASGNQYLWTLQIPDNYEGDQLTINATSCGSECYPCSCIYVYGECICDIAYSDTLITTLYNKQNDRQSNIQPSLYALLGADLGDSDIIDINKFPLDLILTNGPDVEGILLQKYQPVLSEGGAANIMVEVHFSGAEIIDGSDSKTSFYRTLDYLDYNAYSFIQGVFVKATPGESIYCNISIWINNTEHINYVLEIIMPTQKEISEYNEKINKSEDKTKPIDNGPFDYVDKKKGIDRYRYNGGSLKNTKYYVNGILIIDIPISIPKNVTITVKEDVLVKTGGHISMEKGGVLDIGGSFTSDVTLDIDAGTIKVNKDITLTNNILKRVKLNCTGTQLFILTGKNQNIKGETYFNVLRINEGLESVPKVDKKKVTANKVQFKSIPTHYPDSNDIFEKLPFDFKPQNGSSKPSDDIKKRTIWALLYLLCINDEMKPSSKFDFTFRVFSNNRFNSYYTSGGKSKPYSVTIDFGLSWNSKNFEGTLTYNEGGTKYVFVASPKKEVIYETVKKATDDLQKLADDTMKEMKDEYKQSIGEMILLQGASITDGYMQIALENVAIFIEKKGEIEELMKNQMEFFECLYDYYEIKKGSL